ncbi:MAG TPA: nucleotidyltransferase family protein [Candidatus Wallbacteria bacterium]|nr:nucleotidyltransferase family protein [Candidatus Wallbacteria bacterium]
MNKIIASAYKRPDELFGLVLAAGESSRMGTEKQLLTYRGRTFIERAIDGFIHAGIKSIAVVLGHKYELMKSRLKTSYPPAILTMSDTEIIFAENASYKLGQFSSIRRGISAVCEKKSVDFYSGFMIQLIDRPTVEPETFKKLKEEFLNSPKSIVIPSFEMHRGHPVCISSAYIGKILELADTSSLREIINSNNEDIAYLNVCDPGIILNIDTPGEYEKIKGA